MTGALSLETPDRVAPVDITSTDDRITARWSEGEEVHDLVLRTSGKEETQIVRARLEALIDFCYRSGFEDASNPRFFVP